MHPGGPSARSRRQAGFSLVEMMMAAVILGVGILGLTLLQAMALRGRGSSQNRNTAVEVGERILDQVEEEGRTTWLNDTSTSLAPGAAVPDLLYFNAGQPNVTQYFDVTGTPLASIQHSVFTTVTSGIAVANPGATGSLSDVTVTVTFQEASRPGQTVTHQVVLTRRVLHG